MQEEKNEKEKLNLVIGYGAQLLHAACRLR